MYIEHKFALQEVLQLSTGDSSLSWLLRKNAIDALKDQESLVDYDLDDPHFIARDAHVIVQFFRKTKT